MSDAAASIGAGRAWWLAIRPKTLSATFAPVMVGTAVAYSAGAQHILTAIAALSAALLIQIGTNLSNDLFDFRRGADSGDRLGPTRAVQSGVLTPRAVGLGAVAAFVLAAVIGLYLVYVGGRPILLLGLAAIVSGIAYTAGPLPLAYVGLGDLFVMVFFGIAAVAGTFYVQVEASTIALASSLALQFMPIAIWLGVAVGALAVAILVVNNLRDIETDAAAGKRTLAVRMGARATRLYFTVLVIAAFAIPIGLALLPVLPEHATLQGPSLSADSARPLMLLMVLGAAPLAWAVIRRVSSGVSGRELNPILAQTARLQMVHAGLIALGLVIDALLRGAGISAR